MTFHKRIKKARITAGLSQIEVSEIFKTHGFLVKPYVISSWETGKHKPDIMQFAALCEAYNADAMQLLTGKIVKNGKVGKSEMVFNGLNKIGREHALKYIKLLKTEAIFTEKESEPLKFSTFRLYEIPVSAGTGMFLDNNEYEEITADKQLPEGMDYAVRVKGDSMEPQFFDGQIIFIKEQKSLNDGEIGIFSLNGEAYVKKLSKNKLVSLNLKYKPIILKEHDEFFVFGKVVGVY